MVESLGDASAETSSPQATPHERAQALFEVLPSASGNYRRTHVCPDGSRVYGSDWYRNGKHFFFIVDGPDRGEFKDFRDTKVRFDFASSIVRGAGDWGTIILPKLGITLGGEQVATIPSSGEATPLGEAGQHALLDWAGEIVETNRYSPLRLSTATI